MNFFKILLIIVLILVLVSFSIKDTFAENNICIWDINEGSILNEKESKKYELTYTVKFDDLSQPTINCVYLEPTSIQNKLIHISFLAESTNNYEMFFSLIDSQGNKISTKMISDWYGIPPNKLAHVFLDPQDFDQKPISLEQIEIFQISVAPDSIDSVSFSDIGIEQIKENENFTIYENLPVQQILPGFLFLIFIIYPSGFLITEFVKFGKGMNFVYKIPLQIALGLSIFIIYTFLISFFWISFATIIVFLVVEYLIFTKYLITKIKNGISIHVDKTSVFFLILIFLSGFFSITILEQTGWPNDPNDSFAHVSYISLLLANERYPQGLSMEPIVNAELLHSVTYPPGSYTISAGLSTLLGIFPATSYIVVFGLSFFLIPLILTSIVFRYTNSISISSIMFVLPYVRPFSFEFWYGDLMFNKWAGGLFAGEVGIIILLSSFIIFLELFERKKRKEKKLLALAFTITIISLILAYYGYIIIALLPVLIYVVIYLIKNKKLKFLIISSLVAAFLSKPLWYEFLVKIGFTDMFATIPYRHFIYIKHLPWDSNDFLFPFWISSIIAIITASILIKGKKYRLLSIIFIIIFVTHLGAFSEELAENYFFFNKNLRSLGLVFLLSFSINLIFIKEISNKIKSHFPSLSSKKSLIIGCKVSTIAIAFLIPVFLLTWIPYIGYDTTTPNYWTAIKAPGGNEKNIHLWLYNNAEIDELVLNDHTFVSQWLFGSKAQHSINNFYLNMAISRTYNPETQMFDPTHQLLQDTINANLILKNPWDYEYIQKTIDEQEIKYIYISEREVTDSRCIRGPESCYPDSQNWPWKNYSGNSRVVMYANHPDLELILRNGNSALFQVT